MSCIHKMSNKKTALIWNSDAEIKYSIVDGDLSKLNGIYLDPCNEWNPEENELFQKIFNSDGEYKIKFCNLKEFAEAIRNGANIVECGWII